MTLEAELQRIYDSEISLTISWFWDQGVEVKLGDELNGIVAERTFDSVADVLPWLQAQIRHHYPESDYAKSLA